MSRPIKVDSLHLKWIRLRRMIIKYLITKTKKLSEKKMDYSPKFVVRNSIELDDLGNDNRFYWLCLYQDLFAKRKDNRKFIESQDIEFNSVMLSYFICTDLLYKITHLHVSLSHHSTLPTQLNHKNLDINITKFGNFRN